MRAKEIHMDFVWILLAPLLILLFVFRFRKSSTLPLPPGPFAWPLVGSLFSIRTPLHDFYGDLAKKYGPVLLVKVGMVSTVVVSSPKAAEELFKLRDSDFAYKPPIAFFEYVSFKFNDLVYSDNNTWRKLRKISSVHLFSNNKLNMMSTVRTSGVREHVKAIYSNIVNGVAMNLTTRLHELVADSSFLMLFGRQDYRETKGETIFLRSLIYAMEEEFTKFNIGDVYPPLRRLDLQGQAHKWQHELMPPLKEFIAKKIEMHRRSKKMLEATGGFEPKCFLDVLLSLEGEDALPDIKIIGLFTNLLSGGISTQEATSDWVFAELIRHPQVMAKAQQEIDNVVGKDRFVEESDLPNLPYISAIVKEVLRLHTLVPLGSPHYNPQESQIGGYRIPAKSTIFVNLWALSHDPTLWDEAHQFRPERFMDHPDVGYIDNFHFLPFMAGRRICLGYPLAMRFIPLVISILLQSFEWGAAPGQSKADIDMSARLGGIYVRAKELLVSVSPRLPDHLYAE